MDAGLTNMSNRTTQEVGGTGRARRPYRRQSDEFVHQPPTSLGVLGPDAAAQPPCSGPEERKPEHAQDQDREPG